jgi:hypothetical protein
MTTLKEIGFAACENAVVHGFYDEILELLDHKALTVKQKAFIRHLWRANRLMLIVSELAEGMEGMRSSNLSSEPKSGGLGEELADTQIRLAEFAYDEMIDLEKAVINKHTYNLTRPYKHGDKVV